MYAPSRCAVEICADTIASATLACARCHLRWNCEIVGGGGRARDPMQRGVIPEHVQESQSAHIPGLARVVLTYQGRPDEWHSCTIG